MGRERTVDLDGELELDCHKISIEFNDGHLEFYGAYVPHDVREVFVEEDDTIERAMTVEFVVVSDGMKIDEDGAEPLPPGQYIVNSEGLFRRVT